MFQAACPASHKPGLNPTRGSGLGALTFMLGVMPLAAPGDGALDVAIEWAQAAAATDVAKSDNLDRVVMNRTPRGGMG
jgi:hypothetical protein